MEINYENKINELIDNIKNINLNRDWEVELNLLSERKNITYSSFLKNHKVVEKQYNRCLDYLGHNLENDLDKIVSEKMEEFINEDNLYTKYEIMIIIDNLILYNILENN